MVTPGLDLVNAVEPLPLELNSFACVMNTALYCTQC